MSKTTHFRCLSCSDSDCLRHLPQSYYGYCPNHDYPQFPTSDFADLANSHNPPSQAHPFHAYSDSCQLHSFLRHHYSCSHPLPPMNVVHPLNRPQARQYSHATEPLDLHSNYLDCL